MKRSLCVLVLAAAIILWPSAPRAAEAPLARTVIALYDGTIEREPRMTRIHRMVEMPLNHLGIVVRYLDVNAELPPVETLHDVRGVITWFRRTTLKDPDGYLTWIEKSLHAGKRFVVLGDLGVASSDTGLMASLSQMNRIWAFLGLRDVGRSVALTYDVRPVFFDDGLFGFERPLPAVLPAYELMQVIGQGSHSHLTLRESGKPATDAAVVVTSVRGGYAADGYLGYISNDGSERYWYANPFEFFRTAFATDELPKPDTTTLSGRRIYYSHVDGDGWRNISSVDRYAKGEPIYSVEILMKEAIAPYHDLPVTVAPIAGDLDPKWYGDEKMLALARRMFTLPHVEAGSHTYSHPFDWGFFTDWTAQKERPYAKYFPPRPGSTLGGSLFSRWRGQRGAGISDTYMAAEQVETPEGPDGNPGKLRGYKIPRAYAVKPYDHNLEIEGSYNYINTVLPPGKRVAIMQWSGNTLPQDFVVAESRRIGIRNINGGDTRFDPEFPSYAWVAPIGREVGAERQIYASSSNENTYTRLWTSRFYGFRYLEETVRNTDSPIRVKPLNIYYHIYSADRTASLDALLGMLAYARAQEIAPVATSRFAAIADGFYATRIVPIERDRWRIENRGELQTIRFDQAAHRAVDFSRSEGVLGERTHQGRLYVALDSAHAAPIIALQSVAARSARPMPAAQFYLVHARWHLWNFSGAGDSFSVQAQGYGDGEMEWFVPHPGRYKVQLVVNGTDVDAVEVTVGADQILRAKLKAQALSPVLVRVQRLGG